MTTGGPPEPRWRRVPWWTVPVAALTIAYLPDLGHGFVKDDFAWILGSRTSGWSGPADLFQRHNGFYRPLVALSFAINELLSGLRPLAYGLTNFALVLAALAGIHVLARSLGMAAGAAALAAALWALNPHGVGGAILWISGRTSLLLIVFSLAAALALVRGHVAVAAVFLALALFSKEEAVLLPAILLVWAGLEPADGRVAWRWRRALPWAVASLPPLALYFVLRSRTAAFLPLSAPAYYRLTVSPGVVGRNLLEYADRTGTFMAAVLLVWFLAVRRRPRLEVRERAWLVRGLAWLVGGFGITLFVPVRSSLYVCFPSVGAALAAATLATALWREATPRARRAAVVAALVLPFALVPMYWSRNRRMVLTAELSTAVLAQVRPHAARLADGHVLVLQDDPNARINIAGAFGTLLPEAVQLATGVPSPRVWIEPAPPEWRQAGLSRPPGPEIRLALRHGRLESTP